MTLGAANRAAKQLVEEGSKVAGEFLGVDRDSNRFVLQISGEFTDIGKVSGRTYRMFGNRGFVCLIYNAAEDQFPKYLPIFERVANSFRFDDGYKYTDSPTTARERPPVGTLNWIVLVILIGLILAGGVASAPGF
jgi:hypothetical protein